MSTDLLISLIYDVMISYQGTEWFCCEDTEVDRRWDKYLVVRGGGARREGEGREEEEVPREREDICIYIFT